MTVAQTETRSPATPEEIWAILREAAEWRKEYEKEAVKRSEVEANWFKEEAKWRKKEAKWREEDARRREEEAKHREEDRKKWAELWKGFAETKEKFDKADRQISNTNEKVGGLEKTFGEVVEHLVAPGIEDRLAQYGLVFENVYPNAKVKENRQTLAEIDLLLEGDDALLVVEIKAKVKTGDVEKHAARLEKLRKHYDRRKDRRRLIGAMAGAVFNSMEKKAALDAGFFVIVQSGDTMQMDVPEGFKPKEW